MKLALAGAAMTAMLGSLTTALLIGDVDTFDQFRFWAVGSLAGRGSDIATQVAPFILIGIVLALVSGRVLNAFHWATRWPSRSVSGSGWPDCSSR